MRIGGIISAKETEIMSLRRVNIAIMEAIHRIEFSGLAKESSRDVQKVIALHLKI